jgi:hypothetical protein
MFKKIIVGLFLSLFALTASASSFVKIEEDAIVCDSVSDLRYLVQMVQENQEAMFNEYLMFVLEKNRCGLAKPNIIGKVVDVDSDFVLIEGVSVVGRVWVMHTQLVK